MGGDESIGRRLRAAAWMPEFGGKAGRVYGQGQEGAVNWYENWSRDPYQQRQRRPNAREQYDALKGMGRM